MTFDKQADNSFRYDSPDSLTSVGWTVPRTIQLADEDHPFVLTSGKTIAPLVVEYETYGELSQNRDNAIFVAHALTGSAHLAGWDVSASPSWRPWRLTQPGWWDPVVGPGKPLDTNRFFIICANIIGGCYGTTGPTSINPKTNKPYGLDFPIVTVADWVHMEAMLLDRLGIEHLYAIIGASLGGQQALEFSLAYPERVTKCAILASAPKLPTQGLGFNAVARHAIQHDPNYHNGNYYETNQIPRNGLAAARMLGHMTYLSVKSMDLKFGRRWQQQDIDHNGFGAEFAVESYLNHQGKAFVERFDAHSYLYISRAMDYYDAAEAWGNGDLVAACARFKAEALVLAFSTDWLFPPEESQKLVQAMFMNAIPVTYACIETNGGHDAFLTEADKVGRLIRAFLLSPMAVHAATHGRPNHD